MELSRDAIRRSLAEIDAEHRGTLAPTEELIDRLYQDEADPQTKWDVLTGGANRSSVLKVGGVAVLTAAVLAACGSNSDGGGSGAAATTGGSTTSRAASMDAGDMQVLRF